MTLHLPLPKGKSTRSGQRFRRNTQRVHPESLPLAAAKKARTFEYEASEILADYRLAWLSRHISLLGRKEVLNGRAKFGIFGDGLVMA